MDDFFRKLKLLNEEDYIWLIYFFIIILAIISNKLERDYLYTNNHSSYTKYNNINYIILIIAFVIYLYFVIISYENLEILKKTSHKEDVQNAFIRLIVNILFLLGGALSIYTNYKERSNNTNIAFFN